MPVPARVQPSEIVRGDIMLEWSGKHPIEKGKEREIERESAANRIYFKGTDRNTERSGPPPVGRSVGRSDCEGKPWRMQSRT